MDLKLISKNNIGVVSTLFLVIVLSQSRFFNFLIDKNLGRAILILFILGISYTNKFFGVVAVLFIIISFNNSNIGYMEGFTNSKMDSSSSELNKGEVKNNVETKKTEIKNNIETKKTEVKDNKASALSIEGFNIIEREGIMLRGKRSNEVPVLSSAREQDDSVEPIDKSIFSSNFSPV
jgi:hypothetical protein